MRHLSTLRRYTPLLTLAFTAIILFGSASQATADTGSQAITMSPASTQLSVAPGASTTGKLTLINSGDTTYGVTASVSPYHVKGVNYDPQFSRLPGTTDTAAWVHLDTTSTAIDSHKVATISYSVNIPKNTAPGGYYAVIFAETNPVKSTSSGVMAHNRVGNILYITVTGPVKTSGSVEATPLAHLAIQPSLPIGVTISNTGGVHFLSSTTVTVKGITGKQLFHSSLDRYVLPQTKRLISTTWTPAAPIGLYLVSRTATVAGTPQTLPDQWVVFIQPWLFYTLCILLVIIILFTTSSLYRRRKRVQIRR